MRVITGSARGRKLQSVEGLDTRPTSEKVKEAVFSMIQFELPGAKVLDLFAGTGQMGIEALSRDASLCVFIDTSRAAQEVIKANLATTGLSQKSRVASMEAEGFLASTKDTFDIVFMDPPYGKGYIAKLLPEVVKKVSDYATIICEHEGECELPELVGEFSLYRTYRYGKIYITTYKKTND